MCPGSSPWPLSFLEQASGASSLGHTLVALQLEQVAGPAERRGERETLPARELG